MDRDHHKVMSILDYLNISFLLFDLKYTLTDTNETFLKFTDAKRDKIIGPDIRNFLTKEEHEKLNNHRDHNGYEI